MKRGLTLGKYAPLHRGHQYVVETGLAEMDEMTAIVYDAPDITEVPLSVRSDWLRSLYPSLRVVEAWDGPTEVGYSPELMAGHERYVLDELDIGEITHFYSSEPYGEHMSRALGAVDRRVDHRREQIPVSATAVRRDPFAHRRYLDPRVYRDLVSNVVFLGAPCTGKTTLARRLANAFGTEWMPEYGREYWERHHVNRRLEPEQLLEIAEEHILRETALLERSDTYLFTDTNAVTTATFARCYHGTVLPKLQALAAEAAARYDLVFLCDTDIPDCRTWDRSGRVPRNAFQRQVIGDLKRLRVPYVRIAGSVDQRIDQVRGLLARFRKYTNVLDL
jgi:NadR type nicotinamide-nucleotide adenylyltransferase